MRRQMHEVEVSGAGELQIRPQERKRFTAEQACRKLGRGRLGIDIEQPRGEHAHRNVFSRKQQMLEWIDGAGVDPAAQQGRGGGRR